MRQYQDVFGLISIYVGAVVGAGFASGQEINQFFVQFGREGVVGIAVATLILVTLGRFLMNAAYQYQLSEYREAIKTLMGAYATVWGDIIAGSFLFAGLAIMIAGGGEVLSVIFPLPQGATSVVFGLFIVAGVSHGASGLFKINKILVPLLILVVLALLSGRFIPGWELRAVMTISPQMPALITVPQISLLPNWLVAAVLYAAFNLGTVLTVFASLGNHIPDSLAAKKAGTLSGLVLGVLLVLFWWGITYTPGASESPIPMAYLASLSSQFAQTPYLFLLLAAMYTSAVADVFALVSRYQFISGLPLLSAVLVVSFSWVIAQGGFVPLISTVYPAYGYLWTVMLIVVLIRQRVAGCYK